MLITEAWPKGISATPPVRHINYYCAGHNYTTAFMFCGVSFYQTFRDYRKICDFDAPFLFGDCSAKKKRLFFTGRTYRNDRHNTWEFISLLVSIAV